MTYAIIRREATGLVLAVRGARNRSEAELWTRYLNGLASAEGSADRYELAPAAS